MLWMDKYRPATLAKLDYHADVSAKLAKLAASGDFPHLLFYGPSGAGKKTRVMAFLKEVYGAGADKLKVEHRSFKLPSSTTIELTTVASLYHIEVNPSDAGFHDRIVVQEVIKEIAQSPPLDQSTQRSFKIIVLNEVEKLSKEAQHALRRTMEKYVSACRLILCCDSTSKVIDPVRSRCLGVRVPAPSNDDVRAVLGRVARREGIALPDSLADELTVAAARNMRKALLLLEATKLRAYPFPPNARPVLPDWELFVAAIAAEMLADQSPRVILSVRGKLYELLSHCIPADVILKRIVTELLKTLGDASLKYELVACAALYDHRCRQGQRAIFHLEAFVAKFLSFYKNYSLAMFGE